MSQEINEHFRTFSRGLMHSDYTIAYTGYRALYKIGPSVLPTLVESVFKCDFSDFKFKELSRYVTGLVSLIHDIDEKEGNEIINKIISNGCPDHLKHQLHSISLFSKEEYIDYQVEAIEIMEHKALGPRCEIKPFIRDWLKNIPKSDLDGIDRIIICKPDDIEAAGTYRPILQTISIAWGDNYGKFPLAFKIFLFLTEHTLYHEIGHHVHRHTFGQDPIQEKEANRYAARAMKVSHPKIGHFIKLLRTTGNLVRP